MPAPDFETSAAFLIHDTARLIRRRFDQSIQDLGLTQAKWRVLTSLRLNPGIHQTELAGLLGIEKAPLGFTLDRLERAGWLRREVDPADRRARRVYLEERVAPLLRVILDRFHAVEAQYLRGFDEAEVHDLMGSLRAIRTALWAREQRAPMQLAGAGADTYLTVLVDCERSLRRQFDARLADLGFTRQQWLVLNTIERQQGIRQTALAEATELSAPAIGRLVDALESKLWVERRADPRDRRANRMFLTRRATQLVATTRQRFATLHVDVDGALDDAHRRTLVGRLGWIRQRLLEETQHHAEARRAGAA